ncbi:MAG TPA: EAL domain-containing protein [Vicinamibacterales bacterium]|nr:EAL domain-containing protein [Vicinamibacterales bacterium]
MDLVVEISGLILTAIVVSAVATRWVRTDSGIMQPFFVIDVTALLLLGPRVAMFVAAAGAITRGLVDSKAAQPLPRVIARAVTAVIAIQTTGLAHWLLGGTVGDLGWPWQIGPLAGDVAAYLFTTRTSANVIEPLLSGEEPITRSRPNVLMAFPPYIVGMSIAVGLVTLIEQQWWEALPVVAVPLLFVCFAYYDYKRRVEDDRRRREVLESLDQGLSVLDRDGIITFWDDALEYIVGCSRHQAIGHSVFDALPSLRNTDLPRAITDALTKNTSRALTHLGVTFSSGSRMLNVSVLAVDDGVSLLWQDVTVRSREEQALKRNEERLSLAAQGANDGLWEWDLRSGEFYVSGRWRALLGLPSEAAIVRAEEWINRVHDDDIIPLREALEAHVSGKTDHFQLEHRIRHEDGTYRRFLCRGIAIRGVDRPRIAGSLTDTTERAKEQEQLRSAGFRDPLTGLSNRSVFVEDLGRRLDEFKRRRGERFAVLYLDLDRFKVVNDSLGHMVGDELLIAVSRRLESCLRPADALARLGGDEFAILLNGLSDEQQAIVIAFRIQESLGAPFSIGNREVFTSASIGIAPGLSEYSNPEEIMRDADTAMYHAKARGKARHELFDADMHARTRDRLGLENDLRHAVSNRDFEVKYQPIVSLASGRCVGFESLVRWTRHGEAIPPATFIPIAEELGLIEALGTWVMEQACFAFAYWLRRFPKSGLEWITVNVSSRQLMQQNFMRLVEQAVHQSGLRPNDVRLEITETALMDSPNIVAEVLRELRDFGVKIYLDDFGTGYSSLSHLHKLPVDALKIDRSFVKSLLVPDRPATVESILALARTLNTSVVAEGIENAGEAHELERLGCTHAQGFFFSRPLSKEAVETLLMADEPLGAQHQPSDLVIAARREPVFFSKPFEWPERLLSQ